MIAFELALKWKDREAGEQSQAVYIIAAGPMNALADMEAMARGFTLGQVHTVNVIPLHHIQEQIGCPLYADTCFDLVPECTQDLPAPQR